MSASTNPLDQLLREDVVAALVDQKIPREVAARAAKGATGVTFTELYRSAFQWAQQVSGRKDTPMPAAQPIPAKANGHLGAAEKRCAGFEKDCSEVLPPMNRTGLCTNCYARKKYREQHPGRDVTPATKRAPERTAKAMKSAQVEAAPPVAARVALKVTEAQLDQFLVKLSLEDKRRIANYFLETAESD